MSTVISLNPMQARSVGAGSATQGRWARLGQRVWASLETVGQARARSELLALASHYEAVQPEFAAQLRRAAQDVRH